MKYYSFVELINCADLAFVARAVCEDKNQPQYWYMKIEKRDNNLFAIATDGRRLHKAQLSKKDIASASPGYWRVLKNKAVKERDYEFEEHFDHELDFYSRVYTRKNILWLARLNKFDFFPPDDVINRLFPQGNRLKEGIVDTRKYHSGSINALIKNLPDSAGINPKYLKDLGPYEWNYKIFSTSGDKPVLFEHENKTALIMPLNLNQN